MAASGAPLFLLVLPPSRRADRDRRAGGVAADRGAARRQCREPLHRLGRVGGGGRRARRSRRGGRRCEASPTRPRPMPRRCSSCSRAATATRSTPSTPPAPPISWSARSASRSSSRRLQFAHRHAERVGGRRPLRRGERGAEGSPAPPRGAGSRARDRRAEPGAGAQGRAGRGSGQRISLMELFRKLDPDGRKAARGAIDRLLATGQSTAFAHRDGAGDGARLAHHVRVEGGRRAVVGRTEAIVRSTAAAWQSRDPMTGVRDGRAARAWIGRQLALAGEGQPVWSCSCSRSAASTRSTPPSAGRPATPCSRRPRGGSSGSSTADGRRRLVARMAGAEFAILLAAPTSLGEGRFLAGQLVEAIGRPFMSGDHVITLGSRAGVAARRPGDDCPPACCAAPAPLWPRPRRARTAGRFGCSRRARPATPRSATSSRSTSGARSTRTRSRSCSSRRSRSRPGEIVGAEALARWRHPAIGELGAVTLFSVAERSDYLVQLSDHVQRKAIAAAAAWPEALARLRLSVNITAADIVRPGFAEQFLALVARAASIPAGSPSRSPRAA
jgi:hypothetical protein